MAEAVRERSKKKKNKSLNNSTKCDELVNEITRIPSAPMLSMEIKDHEEDTVSNVIKSDSSLSCYRKIDSTSITDSSISNQDKAIDLSKKTNDEDIIKDQSEVFSNPLMLSSLTKDETRNFSEHIVPQTENFNTQNKIPSAPLISLPSFEYNISSLNIDSHSDYNMSASGSSSLFKIDNINNQLNENVFNNENKKEKFKADVFSTDTKEMFVSGVLSENIKQEVVNEVLLTDTTEKIDSLTKEKTVSLVVGEVLLKENNCIEKKNFENAINSVRSVTPSKEIMSLYSAKEIEPFTEEQLRNFYFNPELLKIDLFVGEFLKNANKVHHRFYELVDFYYKSRIKVQDLKVKMKLAQKNVNEGQKKLWEIKDFTYTVEGKCGCGNSVSQQHRYQKAFFQQNHFTQLSLDMLSLREVVHEFYQLQEYNSRLGKLRIENYIYKLFKMEPALSNVSNERPISVYLPCDLTERTISTLYNLQDCISVLFSFLRIGAVEKEFDEDINRWLDLMVSALQRVGTLPDHFFLLNHIIRCPCGVPTAKAQYIQFPTFNAHQLLSVWTRPQVHHFVVMLATLTLPVRARTEFLSKFKVNYTRKVKRQISWTLVDEDSYEDENHDDSWSLITEQDLIAMFDQFPFSDLFLSLLNINSTQDEISHLPTSTLSRDILSLFAFSSLMIKLLAQIFETYNLLRYRQFIKHVSRTIRLIAQIVSDQWVAYYKYRTEVIGDNLEDFPKMSETSGFNLLRLQLEFDQFMLRTFNIIVSSKCSNGSMQFLSTMPFDAISSSAIWMLLHMLISQQTMTEIIKSSSILDLPSIVTLEISPTDCIFLQTAISNIALSRTKNDKTLVEACVKLIVELSFLNPTVDKLYAKNGLDMLSLISNKHPFITSFLIVMTSKMLKQLDEHLVNIFHSLHLYLWFPQITDFDIIRTWLLDSPITSTESKVARILLSGINYGIGQVDNTLFLPRSYHYLVAILIVEIYGILFPNNPGGMQQLNYSSMGILEQVSRIAILSYNKVVYYQVHSEFYKWAWKVMLMLKLHESDMLNTTMQDENLYDQNCSTWANNIIQHLENKYPYDFDIQTTPVLLNVLRASESQGLLASYVIFAMTKYGHLLDVFISKGMPYLLQLSYANEYDAVIRIISNLSVLFVQHPDRLATDSYLKLLLCSIHIDVGCAGYTEKLWQYFVVGNYSQTFVSLVTSHILKSRDYSDAHLAIKFWMHMFTRLPFWHRDYSVLFQIDNLCKVAFSVHDGLSKVQDMLFNEYKELIKLNEPRGILSSVMSWMSSNQLISFMPSVTTNFCYFAYVVLVVEQRYEKSIDFWKMISLEMLMNLSVTAEQAYKKVSMGLKSSYLPPFHTLSVYRWGEQAMSTPSSHPLLPIIWQQFFMIFLKKPTSSSGFPSRSGIGHRFFQNTSLISTLKNMKSSLYGSADYHKNIIESNNNSNDDHKLDSNDFNLSLMHLYKTFALWLDESRLHDSNLYLASLPDVYRCDLLTKIFTGNKDLWLEFVDKKFLEKNLQTDFSLWRNIVYAPYSFNTSEIVTDVLMQAEVFQRIIKRLLRETKPQPPLQIIKPSPPIEDVSQHSLLIEPQLMQIIYCDIESIVQLSKSAAILVAKHLELDYNYLELVPDLYETVLRKVTVGIPCDGQRRRKSVGCLSPAQSVIQFNELLLHEQIMRILQDNREMCKNLLQLSTSQIDDKICKSVLRLECIIEVLSESFSDEIKEVSSIAIKLFYLIAQLVDNDVKKSPLAIQFFSTALENLGKNFIANNPTQQVPLLDTVLKRQELIVFLGHHFSPLLDVTNFTVLYSKLANHLDASYSTTVFVLLSKFDINAWLDCSPPDSEKLKIVMLMMIALKNLGSQPNSEATVVLEIVRKQISILFCDFNSYYSKVLVELLEISSSRSISPVFWTDFVAFVQDSTAKRDLSITQVNESVHFLISYFQNKTHEVVCNLDSLYESWSIYIESLSILLKTLVTMIIKCSFATTSNNLERLVKDNWVICCSLYQPWLVPQSKGKIWSLLRTDLVAMMISSFTECINLLTVPAKNGYCSVLNYLWDFYYQSIVPAVTEKQSLDLFHSVFITLPWSKMYPSLEELNQILESHITYPAAFPFFVELFFNIDLENVVCNCSLIESPNILGQFHQVLLNIFVVMATNQELKFSCNKLKDVFYKARSLYWNFMVLEQTARSCQWFAETADSFSVFNQESLTWSMINMLEFVCGYHDDGSQFLHDDYIIAKRNIFVQVIVTLISRCSLTVTPKSANYSFVINRLFSLIESVLVYNSSESAQMQELVVHCVTAFNLLNSISSSEIFAVIKENIHSYLQGSKSQLLVLAFISAASRSIASLEHLVSILEMSIECFFSRLCGEESQNSWVQVYQAFVLPELNKEEFLKEALNQSAYLTLYTFNLHLIPQAQCLGEYLIMLANTIQWCSKPSAPIDYESKLLLLWLQIFDIVRILDLRDLSKTQHQQLIKHLNFFNIFCQSKSEEKIYSGILGSLGVGRKSHLSKEFRLSAKAVHLFLINKMVLFQNGSDLKQATTSRISPDAEKALASFFGLLKNKTYEDFQDQIQWIVQFISNQSTTIKDGCSLVAYLCQQFFKKYSYVSAAIT
ncbi:ectopic P granules protein 5 homolog isoform X1 [Hydra vulgaris]|uniref:ectopic P granules protein 5 homolog isoform X1 n=1 Tax=Hydra vulgaris TaxID=6087 RepID=UPI001F5E84D4|nr:ectopic P granules protein 5 homolog isoform X1 [Hydra vulgaris]